MENAYKIWYEQGWTWILGARAHKDKCKPFLSYLFKQEVKWALQQKNRSSDAIEDDWLNEILARAESLSSFFTLEPDWPSTFIGKEFIVSIYELDDFIFGWFQHKSTRVLLSINLKNFQVYSSASGYEFDIASGMVLSWFLDCCTCLRDSAHPHFELNKSSKKNVKKVKKWGGKTFSGTDQYSLNKELVSKGSYSLPRAFRVRGHIRELPRGYVPSEEARMNAPAYIRRNLEPNETFVQAHSRSGYDSQFEELKKHLKLNSNLADAAGRLNL